MLSCISSLNQLVLRPLVCVSSTTRLLHISPINDAARKGTREKAKKKKVKVEVKKVGFIPHNMRGKDK
jgi:large subunit ribosomal protein L1